MRAPTRVKPIVALALVVLTACATPQPPLPQLAAARSAISQAQSLASRYAPAELQAARTKLARAEAAYRGNEWTEARRLAEQAEVDAGFALAVAENERSRRASAELAQSIDQLKRELESRAQ